MAVTKTTTFSESNISVADNSSSLTINIYFSANNQSTWFESAKLSCTCNGTTKTKNVSHSIGGSVSASFTFSGIKHNNDGTKSVSWSWKCPTDTSVLGTVSASGTRTLTTINRKANVTSGTDFTDETAPTIKYTNPAKFRINARLEFAPTSGSGSKISRNNISSTGTYTFTFTEEEKQLLRQKCTGTSMTVREVIATCVSGTTESQWSYVDKKMTIVNGNPTFSDFDYEDINPATLAITGNDPSKIVKGFSTLQVTIPVANKAIAQKEATMSHYLINGERVEYSDSTDVSKTFTNWNNETDTIEVKAVDSRGISTPVPKTLIIANYNPLQASNISITRDGNISKESKLCYSGNATYELPNGNTNVLTASYKYKKTTDSTYTTGTTIITPTLANDGSFELKDGNNIGKYIEGDVVGGFNINSSYNIIVEVSDVLSTIQYTMTLNSGIPAISIKGNNVALHGVYDEQLGGTQLNGDLYLNGQNFFTALGLDTNTYNPSSTYSSGAMVIYKNVIYECNTNNTTGTWDPSKWDVVPIIVP